MQQTHLYKDSHLLYGQGSESYINKIFEVSEHKVFTGTNSREVKGTLDQTIHHSPFAGVSIKDGKAVSSTISPYNMRNVIDPSVADSTPLKFDLDHSWNHHLPDEFKTVGDIRAAIVVDEFQIVPKSLQAKFGTPEALAEFNKYWYSPTDVMKLDKIYTVGGKEIPYGSRPFSKTFSYVDTKGVSRTYKIDKQIVYIDKVHFRERVSTGDGYYDVLDDAKIAKLNVHLDEVYNPGKYLVSFGDGFSAFNSIKRGMTGHGKQAQGGGYKTWEFPVQNPDGTATSITVTFEESLSRNGAYARFERMLFGDTSTNDHFGIGYFGKVGVDKAGNVLPVEGVTRPDYGGLEGIIPGVKNHHTTYISVQGKFGQSTKNDEIYSREFFLDTYPEHFLHESGQLIKVKHSDVTVIDIFLDVTGAIPRDRAYFGKLREISGSRSTIEPSGQSFDAWVDKRHPWYRMDRKLGPVESKRSMYAGMSVDDVIDVAGQAMHKFDNQFKRLLDGLHLKPIRRHGTLGTGRYPGNNDFTKVYETKLGIFRKYLKDHISPIVEDIWGSGSPLLNDELPKKSLTMEDIYGKDGTALREVNLATQTRNEIFDPVDLVIQIDGLSYDLSADLEAMPYDTLSGMLYAVNQDWINSLNDQLDSQLVNSFDSSVVTYMSPEYGILMYSLVYKIANIQGTFDGNSIMFDLIVDVNDPNTIWVEDNGNMVAKDLLLDGALNPDVFVQNIDQTQIDTGFLPIPTFTTAQGHIDYNHIIYQIYKSNLRTYEQILSFSQLIPNFWEPIITSFDESDLDALFDRYLMIEDRYIREALSAEIKIYDKSGVEVSIS
ncbi:MAG: hypothetical protein IH840_08705, partial [Candidatus Heimdallarchaeota archaeon]|nr:hypothetical protein [Candidatus Heimdallarchaeota archaeon]